MMPLIKLGPFPLSSFGLILLLTIMFCGWLFERLVKSGGTKPLPDFLSLGLVIASFIGARTFYILFNFDLYTAQPRLIWQIGFTAFAFPGALFTGGLLLFIIARFYKQPITSWSDPLARLLPWGQAAGMIGMLLSGEGYGRASTLPWAITLLGVPRHPSQIYEAIALIGLGVWLFYIAKRAYPAGILTVHYLVGYGAIRLVLELFRGDSLEIGGLRVAQVIGMALVLGGLRWLWWKAPDVYQEIKAPRVDEFEENPVPLKG